MEVLRLASEADAAAIADIYAPSVRNPASFELVPPSADEMAGRIAAVLQYAPWLVLERLGEVVGYAYAWKHHERAAYQWSVNTSVFVRAAEHRSGVGRRLYTGLFALLSAQGFYVAHAGITLPNVASVRLHESFGFALVGVYPNVGFKLDAWHDVGWWRLPLRAPSAAPLSPRSPAQMAEDSVWQSLVQRKAAL